MEKENEKNGDSLKRYDTVLAFLSLEVMALTCFGFAGTTGLTFLRAIGFCLSLFLVPFLLNATKQEELSKKGIFLLSVLSLFTILLGYSSFWVKMYSSNPFSMIVQNLMVVIGLAGFFLLGYGLKYLKVVKAQYVVFSFLSGIAVLVFITMVYSLVRYGFFYSALNPNKVYYFDGVVFSIANEGKYLDGFSFVEASLSFCKLGSFILASAGGALPFFFEKKEKKKALILLGFALLGLLDMVFVPFKKGLLLLLIVYVFAALIFLCRYFIKKDAKSKKITLLTVNIVYYCLLFIVSLFVFLILLDGFLGQEKGFLDDLPLLGRYYKEGAVLYRLRESISSLFFELDAAEIRHITFSSFVSTLFGSSSLTTYNLPFFEFTILFQNGLLSFILLMILIFVFLKMGINRLLYEDTSIEIASLWMSLFGIFIYLSLLNEEMPFRHLSEIDNVFSPRGSNFVSISRLNTSLIIYFLMGYLCDFLTKKKNGINNATTSLKLSEVKVDE